MLIQNDKIAVIFLVFASKIATIQGYKALLLCASNWEIFLAVVQLEKSLLFCFGNFYDAAKARKKPSLKS